MAISNKNYVYCPMGSGPVVTMVFMSFPTDEEYTAVVKRNGTNEIVAGVSGTATQNESSAHTLSNLVNGDYTIELTGPQTGFVKYGLTVFCGTVCDLYIQGSPAVKNDTNGSGTGSITVTAQSSYPPIEYSLDNSTWQSSNTFNNLISGNYEVYLKDANNCRIDRDVTVGNNSCALTLNFTKTDETGYNLKDGTVSGITTGSVGPPMFSLSGSTPQFNPKFTNLAPGVYVLQVTDNAGCVIRKNVTITAAAPPPDETPPIPSCFNPVIFFSDANPVRFIQKKCNILDETDVLFNDEGHCGEEGGCFFQPINCDDVLTFQFRYQDTVNNTTPVLRAWNYRTKVILQNIPLIDLGSGNYKCERNMNIYSTFCEKEVYLTISSYSAVHDTVLYTHAISEPLHFSKYHNCNLLLEYWNDSDYRGIKYEGTGYVNKLRLEASLDVDDYPQESDVYVKSNGERVKLHEEVIESWLFTVNYCPPYLHKIIALALSHDNVRVGNTLLIKEEPYSFSRIEKYALSRGSGKLITKTYQSKNLIK